MILGIETSCDETAAAVVTRDGEIRANVVASQADLHRQFGGVVPEIASRRHLELFAPVVKEALDDAGVTLSDLELVAVTQGPGLIGALLVGLSAAKGLAWGAGLPLAPVDHLHGHIASLFLSPSRSTRPFSAFWRPAATRSCSTCRTTGGTKPSARRSTTRRERPSTRAHVCSASAIRAGRRSTALAEGGDASAFAFPVARVDGLDFSFSGVKTALLYAVRDLIREELERSRSDLAASYQRAIVAALVGRVRDAIDRRGPAHVAVVGGVAANSQLRAALPEASFPPLALATDNAAMIASAARWVEPLPPDVYLALDAYAAVA